MASLWHSSACGDEHLTSISIDREEIVLDGRQACWQLLVHGRTNRSVVDVTSECQFTSSDVSVVSVTGSGSIEAAGDGEAWVTARYKNQADQVRVRVTNSHAWRSLTFEADLMPILNRHGCNGSGCHGKAEGQNGFKLSVFGFDPPADYDAICVEGRGRRVFPADPPRSLLLQKVSGAAPHGGGVRIPSSSREYAIISAWIELGMPRASADDPFVQRIEIVPKSRQMRMLAKQVLRVEATYSDGRVEDVTQLAQFQSNRPVLASVSDSGVVQTGDVPGSLAVMASFMGHVDVFHVTLPRISDEPFPETVDNNYIDQHVHQRLRQLNIPPSPKATDEEFLRRVYLDVIGRIPTAEEASEFLKSDRVEKRAELVDALLDRPEYADYWALKWSDLLRVNRQALGHKQAYAYYRWIHNCFADNVPMDQMATELLTAEGPLAEAPSGNFYKVVTKPNEMASTLSQVFLGVRIDCAQCHHHPFDRWSQTDYYGMQAFFTQVGFKNSQHGQSLHGFGNRKTVHPRTKASVFAHALGTAEPDEQPPGNRRELLARWMTAGENPWFARNLANRMWAHFMGLGLVEPVDDFRLTNPPTNPELLDALAAQLVAHNFDVKQLIREITASQTYQRANTTLPGNEHDQQNYSRFPFKPLEAEVLFDAVCDATGTEEKFAGVPAGVRAVQLWDSEVRHGFLKLFGRPTRTSACECERVTEPNVSQVLHGLNSPHLQSRIARADGRLVKLVRRSADTDELVGQLYLTYFSRYPNASERREITQYVTTHESRQEAAEDVAWSMMNSLEFLFNH